MGCAEYSRVRGRKPGHLERCWLKLLESASLPMIVSVKCSDLGLTTNVVNPVARHFHGDLIEGWEPVKHVVSRLAALLPGLPRDGQIGVVTHGTAMTWLLGAGDSANRARLWSELTMPVA